MALTSLFPVLHLVAGALTDRLWSYAPRGLLVAVAVAGVALGAGFWLLRHGRPPRPALDTSDAAIRKLSKSARIAATRLNERMRAGLTDEDIDELVIFYERWLNLESELRSRMREELAREGVDMIRLGDALRSVREDY